MQKEVNLLNNEEQDNQKTDNQDPMKYQQFIPEFPTRPPGPPGPGPGRPPGSPGLEPGRPPGGQPPSAPPSFIPRLPREEDRQMQSGPTGFRGPGGGRIIDFRRSARDFRGCINRFTYIWLFNGNNFWFYPISIGRNTIEGFRWRRNRWEYDRIFINRILFHLCF